MRWLRALAPFAVAFTFVGLFAAAGLWTQSPSPQLVQVREIAPNDVEPGDRIAIAGDGFPAGKEARVAFRGTLHRPGQRDIAGAEIVLPGVVTGPDRVEVAFGESAEMLFSGVGARAVHTTFEGDVEVAFTAATQGAAPVAGLLRHAVLDIRPSASSEDRARQPEGERFLSFAGLRVSSVARRGVGLRVEAVQPGSRAASAGIAAGDVVTSFDGVRVASVGDLVPAPGDREATVGLRSDGASDAARLLSVDGFRHAPVVEILGAALFVVAALSIIVLFGSPIHSSVTTSLQRAISRLRARAGSPAGSRRARWVGLARAMFSAAAREAAPPASAALVVDAVACALFAAMPFGQYLVAARLDVGLLFIAGATALAVAAVVAEGSLSAAARAAAHVAWQHVPAALAVATVVLTTGSLRAQEINRAQGGWPWDWFAFRSPAALLALGLLLGCSRITPGGAARPSRLEMLVDDAAAEPRVPRSRWVGAACRAHRLVVAGLAVILFLGGWWLPGLSPAQQDGRPALELAGVAWLLLKTCAVVFALSWAGLALPRRRLEEGTRATTIWRVPLALLSLALTAVWTWWGPERAVELLVSGSLLAVVAIAIVAGAQRLRHGVLSPGGDGHLSPFI
jgi:NADH-quinone oxidoreductase subunit H